MIFLADFIEIFDMAPSTSLYESTLECLGKFCRSPSPEIDMNYAQRLDDEYILQSSRKACSFLRDYIHENETSFHNALQEIPNLENSLRHFLWLQRAIVDPPHSCSLNEARYMAGPGRCLPTMSLHNLIAEIEECARFFLGILNPAIMFVCLRISLLPLSFC